MNIVTLLCFFFFQAEDGIRDLVRSRGLGDVYKRQALKAINMASRLTSAKMVFSFGIDESSQQSFKKIIADVREKNNLTDQPFYLGGYSIGGSCVLKYAEDADKKPNALFAIDPPVDFEQMYHSSKRNIRLSVKTYPNEESVFLVQKIREIMEGTPENSISNYHNMSPYSFSDTSQTAIKKLLKTSIRIYTEPDIHWWMKERDMDFSSMNSTFQSAMINELNILGNENATLITTQHKGYRKPDNNRHPHSWSGRPRPQRPSRSRSRRSTMACVRGRSVMSRDGMPLGGKVSLHVDAIPLLHMGFAAARVPGVNRQCPGLTRQ